MMFRDNARPIWTLNHRDRDTTQKRWNIKNRLKNYNTEKCQSPENPGVLRRDVGSDHALPLS